MDSALFNKAKEAYNAQNWETAIMLFTQCGTGTGAGEACHLCGNALMRLGRQAEAVEAYKAALGDATYRNRGAVFTNLGKVQYSLGDLPAAVEALKMAVKDTNYTGVYKAYNALGDCYSKLGDARSAGTAYRKAALEGNNPDPVKSLINLGICFMQIGRPTDAAEAYKAALECARNPVEAGLINSSLGQAYVAANRMLEANEAFGAAVNYGYQLSPEAASDYDRAREAAGAMNVLGSPVGDASAPFMPSPDRSGFFEIDERFIEDYAKQESDERRRSSRTGLKVAIASVIVIALLLGSAAFLYFQGFGIPTQESAIEGVMTAAFDEADASAYWSKQVSSDARNQVMRSIETNGTCEIIGMDRSSSDTVAIVETSTTAGARSVYRFSLVRDVIGWKVTNVEGIVWSRIADTYTDALSGPVGDVPLPGSYEEAQQAADQATDAPAEGEPAADAPVA